MRQVLHIGNLLLLAALLVRLWRQGLHARYRAFFASLVFDLASGLAMYLAKPGSNLYSEIFFGSIALGVIVRFLVLRELCLLVFHDHPGIESAVRIGVRTSLALAVCIPLVVLGLARLRTGSAYPLLEQFFLFYQSAAFFLTILFAGTVIFVAWFPVALRRNIILYCLGFSVKFIGESALLLLRNIVISPRWRTLASDADMVLEVGTALLWLIWLNRAGEQPLVSIGQRFRGEQAEVALQRLDSLNRSLSGVLHKNRRPPSNSD